MHVSLLLHPSQLVDCESPSCDFLGGVVVPAGEDECCPTCGCRWGNNTYTVGESFSAGDGCNIWYGCIDLNLGCTAGVIVMLHVIKVYSYVLSPISPCNFVAHVQQVVLCVH